MSLDIVSGRDTSMRIKEEYMDYKGMKELELEWMRDTIPRDIQQPKL